MDRESTMELSPSAERLAEATLGSWPAVADAAVWQQGSAARFTLGWIERLIEMLREQAELRLRLAETLTGQFKKQAETSRILTRESTEAWTDLLFPRFPAPGRRRTPQRDLRTTGRARTVGACRYWTTTSASKR